MRSSFRCLGPAGPICLSRSSARCRRSVRERDPELLQKKKKTKKQKKKKRKNNSSKHAMCAKDGHIWDAKKKNHHRPFYDGTDNRAHKTKIFFSACQYIVAHPAKELSAQYHPHTKKLKA